MRWWLFLCYKWEETGFSKRLLAAIKWDGEDTLGDRTAMWISHKMATWPFIIFLFTIKAIIIIAWHMYIGQPLDVYNLFVSEYTLFVDLIILKAALWMRYSDRGQSDRIYDLEMQVIKLEKTIIANQERDELIQLQQTSLINQILDRMNGSK